jgi:hypothetical protein
MFVRLSERATLLAPPKPAKRVPRNAGYRDRRPTQFLPATKRHSYLIFRWQNRDCIRDETPPAKLLITVTMP